jgi:hypothetical protein
MNKPSSSATPPQAPGHASEWDQPRPGQGPDAAGADKVPSVTKLFSRMFGTGGTRAQEHAFVQTEWQETEWLDTRSPPPGFEPAG